MKLFSRKSLVAAAASTALLTGVVAAPANAETVPDEEQVVAEQNAGEDNDDNTEGETGTDNDGSNEAGDDQDGDPQDPEAEEGSSDAFLGGSSDDKGNLDPGQLRDWVAVFTAIIGALSTVFVFMERTNN